MPPTRAEQDSVSSSPSQTDPPVMSTEDLYRGLAELLRQISPGASNPRLVWDIPGNDTPGMLPLVVPAVVLSELARDILEVLEDCGGWLNGEEIGRRLNPRDPFDHTAGTFRRAVEDLKAAGRIETSRHKGYRAM